MFAVAVQKTSLQHTVAPPASTLRATPAFSPLLYLSEEHTANVSALRMFLVALLLPAGVFSTFLCDDVRDFVVELLTQLT